MAAIRISATPATMTTRIWGGCARTRSVQLIRRLFRSSSRTAEASHGAGGYPSSRARRSSSLSSRLLSTMTLHAPSQLLDPALQPRFDRVHAAAGERRDLVER